MGNGATGPQNPFEEMLRLQNKFQQSLAQATMTYVRQLQGLVGPVTPGTLVEVLEGQGVATRVAPGSTVTFEIAVENRQRVHTLVTPMLSPLVNDRGVTWFPEVMVEPASKLLATDEIADFSFVLTAPGDAPVGIFRGACLIYGCSDGVVPINVTIDRGLPAAGATVAKRATDAKSVKKSSKPKAVKTKAKRKAVKGGREDG